MAWEIVVDPVAVLRDGRFARLELFETSQEEARNKRYEELRDPRPL
jgi:hypothetical protein